MGKTLPRAKVRICALIRDAQGRPRIEGDPDKLDPSILAAMTAEEITQAREDFSHGRSSNK